MTLNGAYSFALYDYHSINLTAKLDDISFIELGKIIDPRSNLLVFVFLVLAIFRYLFYR